MHDCVLSLAVFYVLWKLVCEIELIGHTESTIAHSGKARVRLTL